MALELLEDVSDLRILVARVTVWHDDAVQLRAQIVPPVLEHSPVVFVIGSPKDHRQNFNSGKLTSGDATLDLLVQLPAPVATDAIHSSDLLLSHARIPLGVEEHNRSARTMEIEAFATYQRLRDQHGGLTSAPIEGRLNQSTRGRAGTTKHESREALLCATEFLSNTVA